MSTPIVFNKAQTFFIDPATVGNSETTGLTAIDLFFRGKPTIVDNKSGIVSPGVEVFLCETKTDGTPDPQNRIIGGYARKEYEHVATSEDASVETKFEFEFPVLVKTAYRYAICIKFDGEEDYDLWTSVEGKILVGTNDKSAGPAGQYIGEYFEVGSTTTVSTNSNTTLHGITNTPSTLNINNIKSIKDTDLKFNVFAARYVFDTYANTTQTTTDGATYTQTIGKRSYLLPKKNYEFLTFDPLTSTDYLEVRPGELVYQNNVIRPETVVATNGSLVITGSNVNFTQVFNNDSSEEQYIVIHSGTNRNIRKVLNITSNTAIQVDIPLTFSNSQAKFSKVAAGRLSVQGLSNVFKKRENLLLIENSNANSTVRFANNVIEDIIIVDGGSGYSNTDYIRISGGGPNNTVVSVNAIANVVTDSNGTISDVLLTNKGIGFVEDPTYVIYNSLGSNSAGSNASLDFTVGCTLITEFSNAYFRNCQIINLPLNKTEVVGLDVENPAGTSFYMKKHYTYYSTGTGVLDVAIYEPGIGYSNGTLAIFTGGGGTGATAKILTDSAGRIVDVIMTSEGSDYSSAPTINVSGGSGANLIPVLGVDRYNSSQHSAPVNENISLENNKTYESTTNTPLILSRSNEVMKPEVTLTLDTGLTVNTNISSFVEMVITSNNVWATADIESGELDVFYSKYAINNDYTNEHLGNGRAISKHISQKITFADDRYSEDIRVFFDAYRPVGTDLKIYAKIWNNKDPEPFDDKNWTLLEYKNNTESVYSKMGLVDEVEYECGFSSYPNSEFIGTGSITTTLSNTTVIGSGTVFETEFSVDDMVKIYSPLFPTNYTIAIVDSIASNTSLTLNTSISNNNVVGSGLKIDKIEYPQQAFNNFLNDNVVRYYDSNLREYDGYNTAAIKIVFLSENDNVIPRVNNIRVVGVSA